jgi:hypothetical protein
MTDWPRRHSRCGEGPTPTRSLRRRLHLEFAAGEACEDFGVLVETLSGKGHDRIRDRDGTLFIQTTGSWKARITNLETGESITRNFSGPVNNWFFPDGAPARPGTEAHSFAWLTPAEGGPMMWHQCGTIRWIIDENGLFTVVRQTGTSEDLCAVLSG